MFEPRGHDMMSGAILYPPTRADADIAFLFIDQRLPAHVRPRHDRNRDDGAGTRADPAARGRRRPHRHARRAGDRDLCAQWALHRQRPHHQRGLVPARGGADRPCRWPGRSHRRRRLWRQFLRYRRRPGRLLGRGRRDPFGHPALEPQGPGGFRAKYQFIHPENPAINGLSHVLWTGKPQHPEAHARNAVFYGDKAIDRSPCGTGTSARMAQWAAQGKLKPGDDFVHESIIGTLFAAASRRRPRWATATPSSPPSRAGRA